jgi:hypothetical protein
MNRISYLLIAWCMCIATANISNADVLFESGTLGTAGVSWPDLVNGAVPGTSVHSLYFPGSRFHLSERAITTRVGGHFAAEFSGTFFGALVQLENESDFPDSTNLSTPDVMGTTVLTFPNPSAEVFGELSLSLEPGWYALVFGSGLFNTTGTGGTVRNGVDIENPSYMDFDPNLDWFNLDALQASLGRRRFVVEGIILPEPALISLLWPLILIISTLRMK